MPDFGQFRIPGFHHSSRSSEENQKSERFPNELVSSDDIEVAENDRIQTLTNLMTVSKNPSTIFKPPFGTSADEHHSRLGVHAQHLWRYNKITDLKVKLRETQYSCHKTVLSCYSKYFKELLMDQKGTVSVVHLRLPSVTNTAFEVLLTYMYTSELNLTCQNIGKVYTASRKLGVDGALTLCTRILTGKNKNEVHSVYVYVTAKKQGLDDCAAKALKLMTRRFEQIVGTPEFLDLDFTQVKEYLSQDFLATRSEVVVYLAALKWLSVKYLEREQYAADLLSCVRFQMMTLNEVLACFSPPLLPGVLEQKIISDRLLAATCYVAAVTVNEERRFERYSCTPRKYLLKREPIILWDTSIFDPDRHAMYVQEMAATTIQAAYRGFQTRKSIAADLESGVLKKPEVDPMELDTLESSEDEDDEAYLASKSVSGSMYSLFHNIRKSVVSLIGAGEEKKKKSEDEILHKVKDVESEEIPEINSVLRRSSSTNTLVGHVNDLAENTEIKKYTSDSAVDMSSEAFLQGFPHPKHGTVHKVYTRPSLEDNENNKSEGSESSSWASDENQISNENIAGYILLTGGFKSEDSEDDFEGKAMFLYDTSRDEWRRYGSMEKARHHHCLIYFNEEIYFIGGCNPHKTKAGRMIPEKSCYKLDLEARKWSKISKMRCSRMYHAVVELDGKICVIGGKDDKDRLLSSIEIYNSKSNKWEEMETPLETPTMGLGACVHQGYLWVVGGMVQDEEEGTMSLLRDVMCYDPVKKKWNQVEQLPFPRAFSTVVSFEKDVYVIGGTSQLNGAEEEEITSVSDVLFYDTEKNEWASTTELPFPRHFVEASVVGTNLYVLGGLTSYERNAVDEVLMYNKKTASWRSCTPLPEPVCGFAATFVSQVPPQQ